MGKTNVRRRTRKRGLVEEVRAGRLVLPEAEDPWKSGVYCLVDAVFRARAEHATVVVPMLRERLAARPGMKDRVTLRFTDLLEDISSMGRDAVEAYSTEVLNRQLIAGRRKTEVVVDVAARLVDEGLETARKMRGLDPRDLEQLVLTHLTVEPGFGPRVGRHFLRLLGHDHAVAPDDLVRRYLDGLLNWKRRDVDVDEQRERIEAAARRLRIAPLLLDEAIHRAARA